MSKENEVLFCIVEIFEDGTEGDCVAWAINFYKAVEALDKLRSENFNALKDYSLQKMP